MCDWDSCLLHQDMSYLPSLNHDTKTLSRETSKARDVTLQARSQNKYPSSGTWTAVQVFSFHSHVHQSASHVVPCLPCCVM